MATLLTCPDCGHKVAQTAKICPSCNKTITDYHRGPMIVKAKNEAEARGERFQYAGGCAVAAFFLITSLASSMLFGGYALVRYLLA